jgi:hypothetical protein
MPALVSSRTSAALSPGEIPLDALRRAVLLRAGHVAAIGGEFQNLSSGLLIDITTVSGYFEMGIY